MAGPLTGDAAQREQYAQGVEAVASIAERIAKSIPRDHEDPNVILSLTGNDPTKILSWVKDNTRLVQFSWQVRLYASLALMADTPTFVPLPRSADIHTHLMRPRQDRGASKTFPRVGAAR
jgi:hypothetical protein